MPEIVRLRSLLVACAIAPIVGTALGIQDPQEPRTAPWPRHGDYAGVDRCRECHEIEAELVGAGDHAAVVSSAATMGCETCHGPGAAHAADSDGPLSKITFPPELPPATQARLCSRCHAAEARGHGGGGVAGFLRAGLGCTECHFVHEERTPSPMAGVRYRSRAATLESAELVLSARCTECHPVQHAFLLEGGHRDLADVDDGCATCHGHGSHHVVTGGIGRLVSRPDAATDGIATCVSCHDDVDPERAHWPDSTPAFLGDDLSCFDCHRIHAPASDPGTPATNTLCADCHARAFTEHVPAGTVHEPVGRPSTPLDRGCGACHGGAEAHARAGGRPHLVESLRAAPRGVQERACLSCHDGEPALHGLASGAHALRDVSCVDCHSPSPPEGDVRADAEQGCATCHASVAARFRLPNRHPVDDERRMGCSDCHDPHAARRKLRDLELRQETCVGCHREYRGPFVYAHQASRLDGCVACHDPHGSSNRRLLHESTTQQNCIACHGDFPAFHDQTTGSVFTNCLNCHTQVHGSNHSRFFFR